MTEWVRTVWFEDGQQCECSVPKDWIQNQIVNLPGGVKILDERKTPNDNNLNFRPHSVSTDTDDQGYNTHTSSSYATGPPSLQRHSTAHLMHNPNQQQNMQMPDPRLHHNLQNVDPIRQTHTIQSLDPRATNNLQNTRPDTQMPNLDPRMTNMGNASANDHQRDQIGQKRERTTEVSSNMATPNKMSITDKMLNSDGRGGVHCATCNCPHQQNDVFPMREQDFQRSVINVLLDIKQEIRTLSRGPIDLPDLRIEPANDFTEFLRMEETLKDQTTFNTYKQQLAKIGGIDTMDCTKRIMIVLMTNKLMSEFNMEGKGNKKKRPFKNTKSLELITASIHLQIKTTDKLVYDAVKDLLRRAPDRKGGSGRQEQLSDSPSFIVSSSGNSAVPTQTHTFGHGLQHMLTTVKYPSAAGINNIEYDAVELPSQFMENWLYDWSTIQRISGHYQTGEIIPKNIFNQIVKAKHYNAGIATMRQLYFGALDMELHTSEEPWEEVMEKVSKEYAIMKPLNEDSFPCSFLHIFSYGYAAGYYSYKWAEVLSADAFEAFEEIGLENRKEIALLGRRFRDTILALGGSRHPEQVYIDFRGRKADVSALLKSHGLS